MIIMILLILIFISGAYFEIKEYETDTQVNIIYL